MPLDIIAAHLSCVPLPSLEDIGAALMATRNPSGRTFESFLLQVGEDEPEPETRQ